MNRGALLRKKKLAPFAGEREEGERKGTRKKSKSRGEGVRKGRWTGWRRVSERRRKKKVRRDRGWASKRRVKQSWKKGGARRGRGKRGDREDWSIMEGKRKKREGGIERGKMQKDR